MKAIILATSLFFYSHSYATSNTDVISQAKFSCEFSNKQKTILSVDLKKKSAKQLNNTEYDVFPVIGDMNVTAHTTIYGDPIKFFNQTSTIGNGQKVIWDAQLVLMGSNHDDSNFTLVIAYRFEDKTAKATLISYWDGLDGASEAEITEKCTLEY